MEHSNKRERERERERERGGRVVVREGGGGVREEMAIAEGGQFRV